MEPLAPSHSAEVSGLIFAAVSASSRVFLSCLPPLSGLACPSDCQPYALDISKSNVLKLLLGFTFKN